MRLSLGAMVLLMATCANVSATIVAPAPRAVTVRETIGP